jgi:cytochrome c biogenesis protein CcmG/thiol:disulfide interchange protein DsbE
MRVLLALILGGSLGLGGCGPGAMPASFGHRLVGAQAPSFPELSGADHEVGLPGGGPTIKVTVVDFWASWCAGCQQSMPLLDALYRDKRDRGVMVIGVSVDEKENNAYATAQQLHASFPIVADPDMRIAGSYGVAQVPLTFVLDRNNTVRWIGRDLTALRQAVDVVLAE